VIKSIFDNHTIFGKSDLLLMFKAVFGHQALSSSFNLVLAAESAPDF